MNSSTDNQSCTLCGHNKLTLLYECMDKNGAPVLIEQCDRCTVLVPRYSQPLEFELMLEAQIAYHDSDWKEFSDLEARDLADSLSGVIDFYRGFLGIPGKSIVCEIGSGRGGLLQALKNSGYKVIGCDPSNHLVGLAQQAYHFQEDELLPVTAEAFVARLDPSHVSALFMWHVLEHVADPVSLLRLIASRINPGTALIVQAPLIRKEMLYPEHLFMLTEQSVVSLARSTGFKLARIDYDHKLFFISFVFTRLAAPVPSEWIRESDSVAQHVHDGTQERLEAQRLREQVNDLRLSIRRKEEEIRMVRELATERFEAINTQSKMIAERDSVIVSQKELIEERWRSINEMDQLIKERDSTIAAQDQLISERLKSMVQLEQALRERDSALLQFRSELERVRAESVYHHALRQTKRLLGRRVVDSE